MAEEIISNNPGIKEFFSVCDDLIGGKFILANLKITTILKAIASSEELYHIFSQCMEGFNFAKEFKDACESPDGFQMPKSDEKILAFVFCLMLQVDNKKMDLQAFIRDNFDSPDGYGTSYANFTRAVFVPFREGVANVLKNGVNTVSATEVVDTPKVTESVEDTVLNKIRSYVRMISEALDRSTKIKGDNRDNLKVVITALYEAIELKNFSILNALTIPLELTGSRDRTIRAIFEDMKETLYNYYYRAQ